MAVKLNVEIEHLDRLLKKLDYKLIKPSLDKAIGNTAEYAAPVLKTLVGVGPGRPPLGHLAGSITSTSVSDRGRGKARGPATSGLSAAYVAGNWYGRFPDRGTIHIRGRYWSRKARTQIKPTADQHLRTVGKEIAHKWSIH